MLINQFLLLGAALFCIGVYGVIARRNGVMVLMSIELILNSVNINLLAFALQRDGDPAGSVFALYIIAVAAAEVGVWLAMKHAAPVMKAAGGGAIVATSSVAGVIGFPGMAAYVASKHAVYGLVKVAAQEFGSANIRVNAVAPGPIDNRMMQSLGDQLGSGNPQAFRTGIENMVPMARYGTNEEIAQLIAFLSSDAASLLATRNLPLVYSTPVTLPPIGARFTWTSNTFRKIQTCVPAGFRRISTTLPSAGETATGPCGILRSGSRKNQRQNAAST